jgi:hypothetical protein
VTRKVVGVFVRFHAPLPAEAQLHKFDYLLQW